MMRLLVFADEVVRITHLLHRLHPLLPPSLSALSQGEGNYEGAYEHSHHSARDFEHERVGHERVSDVASAANCQCNAVA